MCDESIQNAGTSSTQIAMPPDTPTGFEKNTFEPDAPYDGTMFETYGREYEYVLKRAAEGAEIFTLVDYENDEGELTIEPGLHLVDRVGYFIKNKSVERAHRIFELPNSCRRARNESNHIGDANKMGGSEEVKNENP